MCMTEASPVFVLAWVTARGEAVTPMGQGGRVLFVEHPERGWEIPGGHVEGDEEPEVALHRELLEETGLEGSIVSWNREFYPQGWVAHVMVESDSSNEWLVQDRHVSRVKWWSDVPPVKTWTVEEFQELAAHFSASSEPR